MAKLHISPEAQSDLLNIKQYISEELENQDAAIGTVAGIIISIRGIIQFPAKGAPLSSIIDLQTDYRYLICGNYIVFYRNDEGEIYVMRVLYGKRDYMKILFGKQLIDESNEV